MVSQCEIFGVYVKSRYNLKGVLVQTMHALFLSSNKKKSKRMNRILDVLHLQRQPIYVLLFKAPPRPKIPSPSLSPPPHLPTKSTDEGSEIGAVKSLVFRKHQRKEKVVSYVLVFYFPVHLLFIIL